MTSPSRRKHQTTVRARSPLALKAASLLALLLLAGVASAQRPTATPITPAELNKLPASVHKAARAVLAVSPAEAARVLGDPMVVQAQARLPGPLMRSEDLGQDFDIRFDLPGPELLFQLESEESMIQRIRQERRKYRKEELTFPEQPVLSKEPYYGRDWPRTKMEVEPHFVCHGRLLFEELNADRYGWDLGYFQPLVSAAYFVKDVALLPYHLGTDPCRCYDCNVGKCLPGDPVAYLAYPPEISIPGSAAELFTLGVLAAIFP